MRLILRVCESGSFAATFVHTTRPPFKEANTEAKKEPPITLHHPMHQCTLLPKHTFDIVNLVTLFLPVLKLKLALEGALLAAGAPKEAAKPVVPATAKPLS